MTDTGATVFMKFLRLTSCDNPEYRAAAELYAQSFPYHEQRESRSQADIMNEPEYHFDLIFDGGTFVGEVLSWETDDFIYVEHFCILPSLRGAGYGTKALALLAQKDKTTILEIDPPTDDIAIRRKGFYERARYAENPFFHVHPPYHKGMEGHELVVMSSPSAISPDMFGKFTDYLKNTVMKGCADK